MFEFGAGVRPHPRVRGVQHDELIGVEAPPYAEPVGADSRFVEEFLQRVGLRQLFQTVARVGVGGQHQQFGVDPEGADLEFGTAFEGAFQILGVAPDEGGEFAQLFRAGEGAQRGGGGAPELDRLPAEDTAKSPFDHRRQAPLSSYGRASAGKVKRKIQRNAFPAGIFPGITPPPVSLPRRRGWCALPAYPAGSAPVARRSRGGGTPAGCGGS